MKSGRTLQELAVEVKRQAESKKDYIAPTSDLTFLTSPERQVSELLVKGLRSEFAVKDLAHNQVATHLGIPKAYYDRLRKTYPDLLDINVNKLFRAEPARRMVRTLDGQVRAFLSDRYRRFDYLDLMEAIMPVLGEMPDVQFPSAEITDTHLYIKAVLPRLQGEVKVGDIVQAGVVISDSEVGLGAISAAPMIYRLTCKNGMISETALRRFHVGRKANGGNGDGDPYEVFSDETLQADDKAFWLKTRDIVRASVTETVFNRLLSDLREAAGSEPMQSVEPGLVELSKRYNLSDGERDGVLGFLISGGDLTKYGVLNAVTATAQTVESYDRSVELEKVGGAILALDNAEWQTIAKAK
jgi:hypothetical protein